MCIRLAWKKYTKYVDVNSLLNVGCGLTKTNNMGDHSNTRKKLKIYFVLMASNVVIMRF